MDGKMAKRSRRDLIGKMRGRYRTAAWLDKGKIIDELVRLCDYDRKHVIKLLNAPEQGNPKAKQGSKAKYDEPVKQALQTCLVCCQSDLF